MSCDCHVTPPPPRTSVRHVGSCTSAYLGSRNRKECRPRPKSPPTPRLWSLTKTKMPWRRSRQPWATSLASWPWTNSNRFGTRFLKEIAVLCLLWTIVLLLVKIEPFSNPCFCFFVCLFVVCWCLQEVALKEKLASSGRTLRKRYSVQQSSALAHTTVSKSGNKLFFD